MIDDLAALGPYFAAAAHDPATEPRAPWRSMGELLDEPTMVEERVTAVRTFLAGAGGLAPESIELRVAASVMHLGLSARVLSPLYGLAVLGRPAPPLSLRALRWQPAAGSMFPLSMPAFDQPAAEIDIPQMAQLAEELCEIMRPFGVSRHVLRGNIASSLNGARVALSSAAPQHAAAAQRVLDGLLTSDTLTGTAGTSFDGRFQRRSCCLIYRAAPDRRGQGCGDCVLIDRLRPPARR
ncbi:MAG TPA: (2Fe-2S)-binding protein [Actinospica sp.]|jgi:hypothetical protein|nr:(2Fe-2S)-binding protein [Actinospica sp.]